MKTLSFLLITLCFIFSLYAETNQYNIEYPKTPSSKKLPCIIIAPGSGYHKDRPIIMDLAKQANENGFVSLRFNWTPNKKNLPDSLYILSQFTDVNKMINLIKKIPQIDTTQIFLAGKSLGSVLAYQAAIERYDIKGIILLTPLFSSAENAKQFYPHFDTQLTPVLVVVGSNDPDNTQLTVLYDAASHTKALINIAVVGGNHSLIIGDYTTLPGQGQNLRNITVANQNVINWMLGLIEQ